MRLAVIFVADLERVRTLAIYSCRLHASEKRVAQVPPTTSTFSGWRHVGRRWPVRVN